MTLKFCQTLYHRVPLHSTSGKGVAVAAAEYRISYLRLGADVLYNMIKNSAHQGEDASTCWVGRGLEAIRGTEKY